jgi:hypothetical protein
MRTLTPVTLLNLLAHRTSPCLSLFQPTHRPHPDNQQDPIRFRDLVKVLGSSLRRQYSAADADALLAPFHALGRDHAFWNHTLDGLAIFGAHNRFEVYGLQRPGPELAVAADSFHVKPVIRLLQSAGSVTEHPQSGLRRQTWRGHRARS